MSSASHIPSSSPSNGILAPFIEFVPQNASSTSDHPSPSSSVSALSPVPSPSVSIVSEESRGKSSGPGIQMLAFGVAGPSHTPSPSVSGLLVLVEFPNMSISSSFGIPSPSISSSRASHIPSPSLSCGVKPAFCESVIQSLSAASENPSPSSSVSSIRSPM